MFVWLSHNSKKAAALVWQMHNHIQLPKFSASSPPPRDSQRSQTSWFKYNHNIIIKDGNASVAVLKFFTVTSIAVKWINFWCQRVTLYSILFAKMFCYYIHNIIIIIAILITRSKHTRKHFILHINIFIFSSHFHLKWE